MIPLDGVDPGPSNGQFPTSPFLVDGPVVNRSLHRGIAHRQREVKSIEERDLVMLHGDAYRDYQRRVPKLLMTPRRSSSVSDRLTVSTEIAR